MHFRGKELGMALNMVLNLHRLSFEHFLLLALDESSCQLALKAFPEAGGQTAHDALIQQTANVAVAQCIVRVETSAWVSPVNTQEERIRATILMAVLGVFCCCEVAARKVSMWSAGCVWSSYLANGELAIFQRGTDDHHKAHERLILIRFD